MSHAICGEVFDFASIQNGQALIEKALTQAQLRRHSDYVSRVILLGTPHFSEIITELAQWAVGASNCMNIWGGCVSGLVFDGKIHVEAPSLLVVLLGKQFEAIGADPLQHPALELCLAESDQGDERLAGSPVEQLGPEVPAHLMGLLSYGANYARNPRIEHGRPGREPRSTTQLKASQLLVLNSEGLEFLTPAQTVTEANGLFLLKVNGQSAAQALQSPLEQTRPVGLRLQVLHEDGEMWIPVMAINADGTLSLAAPVVKGQEVRLARRAAKAMSAELKQWLPVVSQHFKGTPPDFGIIMAGVDRTQMCHEHENDLAEVLKALPRTKVIGLLGQASWLENSEHLLSPPRNNRLCISLFNAPPSTQ